MKSKDDGSMRASDLCNWGWRSALHGNLRQLLCHELASDIALTTILPPSMSIDLWQAQAILGLVKYRALQTDALEASRHTNNISKGRQ